MLHKIDALSVLMGITITDTVCIVTHESVYQLEVTEVKGQKVQGQRMLFRGDPDRATG